MPKENEIPKSRTRDTQEFWLAEIEASKRFLNKYHTIGDKITDRYRDENRMERYGYDSSYNILYSNTETMKPVLFSETPEADVRAQLTTSPPARQAAKMLEDVLNIGVKLPETIETVENAVEDLLLSGLGTLRVCYEPTFSEDEDGEEQVVYEEIRYKSVFWRDLYFPEGRNWQSLPWIALRGLYSYDAAIEEFGHSIAAKLDYVLASSQEDQSTHRKETDSAFGLAEVWEIWDKTNRRVVWVSNAKGMDKPIRIDDDPLELDGFFPVPAPMFSCTTNNTIIPVPLFIQYQDLADELDDVSTRIRNLVSNLKRRGVYDASIKDLQNIKNLDDNEFIPVKDFARMAQVGGIKAVIASEDLTEQVGVLQQLYVQRQEIIQAIYQIMGYADILRGVSDPRETASAQRIKGRFGTLRISRFQRDVQRIIRDAMRIAGQIVINRFEPRTIALQTDIPLDQVKVFQEILRQYEPASVMIDVQSDSTIAADDIADKEGIIEFTSAINAFVAQAPAMNQSLGLQVTSELLLIILRKFKMGRDIEQAVMDRVLEMAQLEEQAKQQPPTPSPEQQALALEAQKLQQKAAVDSANLQIKAAELQLKEQELQVEMAKIGLRDTNEKQRIDLEAVRVALDQLALSAEAANPNDNAIVGV